MENHIGLKPYNKKIETELDRVAFALEFQPGQFLTYAKHLPLGLYFVCQGEIEAEHYKTKEVTYSKEPVVIEPDAFFQKEMYNFSIKAVSRCKVFFLSNGIYEKLKKEQHQLIQDYLLKL